MDSEPGGQRISYNGCHEELRLFVGSSFVNTQLVTVYQARTGRLAARCLRLLGGSRFRRVSGLDAGVYLISSCGKAVLLLSL